MSEYVHEYGGRWWDRVVCTARGLWDTIRTGVFMQGCRMGGHWWREAKDSRWNGQHLVCEQCGREAVSYHAPHEREC